MSVLRLNRKHTTLYQDIGLLLEVVQVMRWELEWKMEKEMELEVVNVWNNRLIGDLSQPEAQRHTFLAARTVKRAASLLPAGLLGPVTLEFTRTIGIE